MYTHIHCVVVVILCVYSTQSKNDTITRYFGGVVTSRAVEKSTLARGRETFTVCTRVYIYMNFTVRLYIHIILALLASRAFGTSEFSRARAKVDERWQRRLHSFESVPRSRVAECLTNGRSPRRASTCI